MNIVCACGRTAYRFPQPGGLRVLIDAGNHTLTCSCGLTLLQFNGCVPEEQVVVDVLDHDPDPFARLRVFCSNCNWMHTKVASLGTITLPTDNPVALHRTCCSCAQEVLVGDQAGRRLQIEDAFGPMNWTG